MADIFISYSNADRPKAASIANALKLKGWSVWWDREIPIGKAWDEVIQEQIDAARSVVVLWSKESVRSDWVKNEARTGKQRGILIPVLIEDATVPLEFGHLQAAKLSDWQSGSPHAEFNSLIQGLTRILGRAVSGPLRADQALRARPPAAPPHKAKEKGLGAAREPLNAASISSDVRLDTILGDSRLTLLEKADRCASIFAEIYRSREPSRRKLEEERLQQLLADPSRSISDTFYAAATGSRVADHQDAEEFIEIVEVKVKQEDRARFRQDLALTCQRVIADYAGLKAKEMLKASNDLVKRIWEKPEE